MKDEKESKFFFSAGYLKICSCGQHGSIVTATGSMSLAFASKENAYAAIEAGVSENFLTPEEAKHLRYEVSRCCLTDYQSQVTPLGHLFELLSKVEIRRLLELEEEGGEEGDNDRPGNEKYVM